MTLDNEQLRAMGRLDDVLGELEGLCEKYGGRGRDESERDRRSLQQLCGEASVLYGRVSHLLRTPRIVQAGASHDAAQQVLACRGMSRLLFVREELAAFHSAVKQAIGGAEEMERRGRLAVSPEAAARWAWLIRPLEGIRRCVSGLVGLVATHPRFLNPLLQRVEGWPLYRLISVIATFGGFIGTVVLIVGAIVGVIVGVIVALKFLL